MNKSEWKRLEHKHRAAARIVQQIANAEHAIRWLSRESKEGEDDLRLYLSSESNRRVSVNIYLPKILVQHSILPALKADLARLREDFAEFDVSVPPTVTE